jgi:glutamyl-tRNA reductase
MKLVLAGLNHRTAPVSVREGLAFRPEELGGALQRLRDIKGAREAMILSTCNRVEVTATLDDEVSAQSMLCEFLAEAHGMKPEGLSSYIYTFEAQHAIRHLFRVASSLDSMVVGEPQILGQLKAAFAQAREQGSIGTYLDAVLTRAFSVAKRVRTETEIGQSTVSVSHAAVELARDIFGSLNKKTVLIVGAGKMSESAAKYLQKAGATDILITNRTPERAERMATVFRGRQVPYEEFPGRLHEADIVITSSAAPGYILNYEQVKRAIDARRNQPMFLIDIAVPRNIDPAVHDLEHAFVYDIDDLQRIADQNLNGRRHGAEQAEGIIDEEVARLLARLRARDVAPTIVSLQEQLELLRRNELVRFRSKLGTLTPDQEQALESLTRGIINKIAHGPISELRRQAERAAIQDGAAAEVHNEIVNVVRRVFRLRDEDS